MTGASGAVCLAAIGATTALLWLSPAKAGDQSLPGEFVAKFSVPLQYEVKDAEQRAAGARPGAARNEALRLRIDGQIADAWLGVEVIQIYASRQLPPARSSVDNARNGFQAGSTDLFFVLEAERRLRMVELDLLKLKVELQTKYAEMEGLAGGSP